ncbi:unnamed protein product [Strongylus vulgaris]|uniref:Uncharacterized protein n=1 Tax=Strongylus vulgaris TaxID=40348 RepID=A0A3P7JMW5_STRVU|nr:unnamed protein product [Strongylus vulgaris]
MNKLEPGGCSNTLSESPAPNLSVQFIAADMNNPVERWSPPITEPNYENIVDLTNEKPSGRFRVYCDLRVAGNVQRVQVLAPHERIESILSAQLTADKTIKFWATRKKRVLDCDLFLIDCEDIEEE